MEGNVLVVSNVANATGDNYGNSTTRAVQFKSEGKISVAIKNTISFHISLSNQSICQVPHTKYNKNQLASNNVKQSLISTSKPDIHLFSLELICLKKSKWMLLLS